MIANYKMGGGGGGGKKTRTRGEADVSRTGTCDLNIFRVRISISLGLGISTVSLPDNFLNKLSSIYITQNLLFIFTSFIFGK